jgi:hypothetical protein
MILPNKFGQLILVLSLTTLHFDTHPIEHKSFELNIWYLTKIGPRFYKLSRDRDQTRSWVDNWIY